MTSVSAKLALAAFLGCALPEMVLPAAPAQAADLTDRFRDTHNAKLADLVAERLPGVMETWDMHSIDRIKSITFLQKLVNQYHCKTNESCPIASLTLPENGVLDANTAAEALKILLNHSRVFELSTDTLKQYIGMISMHPQAKNITERIISSYEVTLDKAITSYLKKTNIRDPNVAKMGTDGKIDLGYDLERLYEDYQYILNVESKVENPRSEREIFIELLRDKSPIFSHLPYFLDAPDTDITLRLDELIASLKERIEFVGKANEYNAEVERQIQTAPEPKKDACGTSGWTKANRGFHCA